MSEIYDSGDPLPPVPRNPPARPAPRRKPQRPPARPSASRRAFRWIGRVVFAFSMAANLFILTLFIGSYLLVSRSSNIEDATLREHVQSGSKTSANKIAVVHIEGVILEGMLGYAHKQIDAAAKDAAVKAVVLRINSPGGSITASDDLHRRLCELRDGSAAKRTTGKPIVVSMASLAASGGYYIAMPAKHLVAERTTITGSIGVYASFPNISELATKYGVKMNTIKAGAVKDSGSMFHEMTPQERQLWQDMVDHAYQQFLAVVRDGRDGKLKSPLEAEIKAEKKKIPIRDQKGIVVEEVDYVRRLADGGIFTADKALMYGLIDEIGYLEDAVAVARKTANLGEDHQVISYDRPTSLYQLLTGAQAPPASGGLDVARLARGAVPRLWYLTQQCDLSAWLAAGGAE
jgi:protease-4